MSNPTTPNRSRSSSWQEKLHEHCRSAQLLPPVFNIVSDRRGGRTAWSSTVTIPIPSTAHQQTAHTIAARYWYDGQYVHNAKEDAAEVALRTLTTGSPGSVSTGSSVGSPVASGAADWGRAGQGSQAGWGGMR